MDMATKSNQMSIVFPRTQYSQKDVIVPGATGYLDLNLDCSYTTIPFKLTFAYKFILSVFSLFILIER